MWRVAILTVSVSVATILTFNLVQGSGRLPQQLVRFALTLGLSYFLVSGRSWARWTAVVLYLIAALGAAAGGATLVGRSPGGWAMLAMGLVYAYCVAVLAFSKPVSAFFARGARGGGSSS